MSALHYGEHSPAYDTCHACGERAPRGEDTCEECAACFALEAAAGDAGRVGVAIEFERAVEDGEDTTHFVLTRADAADWLATAGVEAEGLAIDHALDAARDRWHELDTARAKAVRS